VLVVVCFVESIVVIVVVIVIAVVVVVVAAAAAAAAAAVVVVVLVLVLLLSLISYKTHFLNILKSLPHNVGVTGYNIYSNGYVCSC